MAKPSDRSPERELQVVLSVLGGKLSAKEAARRVGMAVQAMHSWKGAFLDAGREGLKRGRTRAMSANRRSHWSMRGSSSHTPAQRPKARYRRWQC